MFNVGKRKKTAGLFLDYAVSLFFFALPLALPPIQFQSPFLPLGTQPALSKPHACKGCGAGLSQLWLCNFCSVWSFMVLSGSWRESVSKPAHALTLSWAGCGEFTPKVEFSLSTVVSLPHDSTPRFCNQRLRRKNRFVGRVLNSVCVTFCLCLHAHMLAWDSPPLL